MLYWICVKPIEACLPTKQFGLKPVFLLFYMTIDKADVSFVDKRARYHNVLNKGTHWSRHQSDSISQIT